MAGKQIRKHIVFSGRVQGVGFRYTACALARSLGLTGWVRNAADGTVEMEAQGDEGAIGELVWNLENGRFIQIDRVVQREIPVISELGFYARY